MTIGFLFWLFFILWAVFGVWTNYPRDTNRGYWPLGGSIVHTILIFLLGWAVFGFPIHGEGSRRDRSDRDGVRVDSR